MKKTIKFIINPVILFMLTLFVSVGVAIACTQPPVEACDQDNCDPVITPSVEITGEPSVEPTIEVTVEPSAEPTIELTSDPTATPANSGGSGVSDGRSQGSDGLCSKPPCVTPGMTIPQGAPNTSSRR